MLSSDPDGGREGAEVAVHTRRGAHQWKVADARALTFDDTPDSPWLLTPPAVRHAFDTLTQAGTPLATSALGPPMMGVKCGCNDAFLVTPDDGKVGGDAAIVAVCAVARRRQSSPRRRGLIERDLLRPIVRGESLARWSCSRQGPTDGVSPGLSARTREPGAAAVHIVWTHAGTPADDRGPMPQLPPHAAHWLGHWRHRLAARSDTRGQMPWWTLFRTASASTAFARIVWSDLGRAPRAALLPEGDPTVPLNTCYVQRARDLLDAQALTALLNSPIAAAWLNVLAEPARGGYRRYLGWTVGLLPLPSAWDRARSILAPLTAAAVQGASPSPNRLTEASAAAYGLELGVLRPLLDWNGT